MTRPSKFAPEFKARAIDLYRSSDGRTIADVAGSWDGHEMSRTATPWPNRSSSASKPS